MAAAGMHEANHADSVTDLRTEYLAANVIKETRRH